MIWYRLQQHIHFTESTQQENNYQTTQELDETQIFKDFSEDTLFSCPTPGNQCHFISEIFWCVKYILYMYNFWHFLMSSSSYFMYKHFHNFSMFTKQNSNWQIGTDEKTYVITRYRHIRGSIFLRYWWLGSGIIWHLHYLWYLMISHTFLFLTQIQII